MVWAYSLYAGLSPSKAVILWGTLVPKTDLEAGPGSATRTLSRWHIEPESWEVSAQNRASWRNLVNRGVSNHEREFIAQAVEKRKRRKEETREPTNYWSVFPLCPHCNHSFCARTVDVSHMRTHS